MLKFVFIFIISVACLQSSDFLKNDASSFERVISSAYLHFNASKHLSVAPKISIDLERRIKNLAKEFEARQQYRPCHGAVTMLSLLLHSGCKELVELYYYCADSREKKSSSFFPHTTGYEWSSFCDDSFFTDLTDVGEKMRLFTNALLGKSVDCDINNIWFDPGDAWHVHQAWCDDLLSNQSSDLYAAYCHSNNLDVLFPLGCFLSGLFHPHLFVYFTDLFPQFFNGLYWVAQRNKSLQNTKFHNELWVAAWNSHHLCPSKWNIYFGRLVLENKIDHQVISAHFQGQVLDENYNLQKMNQNLPYFSIEGDDMQNSYAANIRIYIANSGINTDMLCYFMNLCGISTQSRHFKLQDANDLIFILEGWMRWISVQDYLDKLCDQEKYYQDNKKRVVPFVIPALMVEEHPKDTSLFLHFFELCKLVRDVDTRYNKSHSCISELIDLLHNKWGYDLSRRVNLGANKAKRFDVYLSVFKEGIVKK